MKTKQSLLDAIREKSLDETIYISTVEDVITQHLDGYVIVKEDDIKLLLSFAPQGEVPKGLDPTFYHTLTYSGDAELQTKINLIRGMIKASQESSDNG